MNITDEQLKEAQEEIISKISMKGLPDNTTIWTESGSIMLDFGDVVAEINEYEVIDYIQQKESRGEN